MLTSFPHGFKGGTQHLLIEEAVDDSPRVAGGIAFVLAGCACWSLLRSCDDNGDCLELISVRDHHPLYDAREMLLFRRKKLSGTYRWAGFGRKAGPATLTNERLPTGASVSLNKRAECDTRSGVSYVPSIRGGHCRP
jgi:hypothetical protein